MYKNAKKYDQIMFRHNKQYDQINVPIPIEKFAESLEKQIDSLEAFNSLKDNLSKYVRSANVGLDRAGIHIDRISTNEIIEVEESQEPFEVIEMRFAKLITDFSGNLFSPGGMYDQFGDEPFFPYALIITTNTIKAAGTSIVFVDEKQASHEPKNIRGVELIYNAHGKRLLYTATSLEALGQLVPFDTHFEKGQEPAIINFGRSNRY